eukprot:CAMPEP_0117683556 /NCGR_PEP_ID=MMETSP0804-20121206/20482_1 /TAXON_ID=1074897 /ORGANISM="Tetraselmis astigmatica, Strain CCMP880" /LENGTH=68 /DNA_ID=CAMNT_0005494195 /DNA_START=30 /DNA_END=233 /DNA_ORIENTATION=-
MASGEGESTSSTAQVLRSLVANYFSVGQFELGRVCLRELEAASPGAAADLLTALCEHGPPPDWLPSVP